MKKKILVAMSGGVDSSAAAALLKEEGHEVTGATMKLLDAPSGKAGDAKKVAETLGFRHLILDYTDPFRDLVIRPFIDEYRKGRTPNPCVLCNAALKFGLLLKKAADLGMDFLATGHYARITQNRLYAALDREKDQSYFLYRLNHGNLGRIIFPLGEMKKTETRALAKRFKLHLHDKKESQDICFTEKGKYRDFIEKEAGRGARGFILDKSGRMLGEHDGLYRYTIGQSRGIGPRGRKMYITAMNGESNSITIGEKKDLLSRGMTVDGVNCCCDEIRAGGRYEARIRYRSAPRACRVESLEQGVMRLVFDEPVEAVAPGQAAVLYRGDEVMGGGVIREPIPLN